MNLATEHETRVRALRDAIYRSDDAERHFHCSRANWDACKAHWLEPEQVKWLEAHQPKMP